MKTTALGESQVKGEEGTNNNGDGGLPLLANGNHAASPKSAKLANRCSRASDKLALVPAIEKIESVQYGAPDFKDANELRAAFDEADEEVKTTARTAIDSQADVIIALAKVQAILSQRGKEKMRRDAGIKLTWTGYYQWFQKEFNFELTLRAVQYKIAELAGKNRNRKCTECGKTGSHATSCSKYKEPTLPHLTQLEAKLLDTASRAHGIVKAVKQGGNVDEAIAEFESNAPTPEKLVEYAERPVKPSLGDVAAQPNKQSGNLWVADKPLNAEEAKLIKPAPQFPVIRQGNESKLFKFLSEGRVDRKSMLDSVFGGIDEGSFLKHLRKFSQRICDKFHDGVYEISVYSKNDRVVIDKAAYDELVAEVAALRKAAKVKTAKSVATETPTAPPEPDTEVVSTTKVGDKSEPTMHGFYYEFVKDEKPYAVRDMNNPHVGVICKFKSKAEVEKYINDREREAAACEKQSSDGKIVGTDGVRVIETKERNGITCEFVEFRGETYTRFFPRKPKKARECWELMPQAARDKFADLLIDENGKPLRPYTAFRLLNYERYKHRNREEGMLRPSEVALLVKFDQQHPDRPVSEWWANHPQNPKNKPAEEPVAEAPANIAPEVKDVLERKKKAAALGLDTGSQCPTEEDGA